MNQKLQQAIQAARVGDNKKAQYLLSQTLQEDPEEVQAWYLLSLLVDSEAKQTAYLQRTLALDPTHEKAQARLVELTAPAVAAEVVEEAAPMSAWVEEEDEEWEVETAVIPPPIPTVPAPDQGEETEEELEATIESLSDILEKTEESAPETALAVQTTAPDKKEKPERKAKSKDAQLQTTLYILVALTIIVGIALIYALITM
jgi:hypothetical protein